MRQPGLQCLPDRVSSAPSGVSANRCGRLTCTERLPGRAVGTLRSARSLSAWCLLGASAFLFALMLSPQGRAMSPLVQLGAYAAADLAFGLGLLQLGIRLARWLSWLNLTIFVYHTAVCWKSSKT